MSDTRTHRQKILTGFLAIMMVLAVGAEITAPIALNAQSDVSSSASDIKNERPSGRKTKFRDQIALLNTANVVASRFLAPIHAPITWTR